MSIRLSAEASTPGGREARAEPSAAMKESVRAFGTCLLDRRSDERFTSLNVGDLTERRYAVSACSRSEDGQRLLGGNLMAGHEISGHLLILMVCCCDPNPKTEDSHPRRGGSEGPVTATSHSSRIARLEYLCVVRPATYMENLQAEESTASAALEG